MMKALWRWFLSKKLLWRMKSSWQMLSLRCHSLRDYEDSPPTMMEDLYDLDDDPNEGRPDMDEWFPKDGD
jgi:hypothetical protein